MRALHSVLYVDDDPDISAIVEATLCAMAGFVVCTAASGERAIELAADWRPDLILMDVVMPGLDGPSTLQRMRATESIAAIPVVFLSAKLMPSEVREFLQLGALGVIGKPFDPRRLCADLADLWRRAEAARSIPPAQVPADTLTERFLQRAARDVVELRDMIQRVRCGDSMAINELQRVAHSIHGAGAMFGYPHISRSGGALERAVETLLSDGERPLAVLQRLVDGTERLSRAVDGARRIGTRGDGMLQGLAGGTTSSPCEAGHVP
jgi:DNA-binding response OmpR family regulator